MKTSIWLSLTLLLANTTMGAEKISEAFGVVLGEKFDVSKAIRTNALPVGGIIFYDFKPDNPFRTFTNCIALASTNSDKVCMIQARADFESIASAQAECDVLMAILERKYGKAESQSVAARLKHQRTFKQGRRVIEIEIQKSGLKTTVVLTYGDDDLTDQAYKEAVENETKNSNLKGL